MASLCARPSSCVVASKRSSLLPARVRSISPRSRTGKLQVQALFTPPSADTKKKVLRREEEPDEYWSSKGEKAGANPFADPIAIVGIVAIFFPFIFLLIAIATGAVDLSVYR